MEEKNELNDIILNKGTGVTGNKKIVLVVATLGVILIIVVMLMNSLTSKGTDNLPQAVLPPEPQAIASQQVQEEPLFEDVEVIQEDNKQEIEDLDKITKRLKEESKRKFIAPKKVVAPIEKVYPREKVTKKAKPTPVIVSTSSKSYFVQVGSFSKYKPDVKFLKSITDKGFKYQYYKVTKNAKTLNKVLIGPFDREKDARNALKIIRSSIESGAFLIKI